MTYYSQRKGEGQLRQKHLKANRQGRLGGSADERLPSAYKPAQGVILESGDQVPHQAPLHGACLCLCLSLCVSHK